MAQVRSFDAVACIRLLIQASGRHVRSKVLFYRLDMVLSDCRILAAFGRFRGTAGRQIGRDLDPGSGEINPLPRAWLDREYHLGRGHWQGFGRVQWPPGT